MSLTHLMAPFNIPSMRKLIGVSWRQSDEEDSWRDKAFESLVKKLRKNDPEEYRALELTLNKKTEDTPCIALSRSQDGRLQVSHRKMLPHVMYCRIFRWPDLQTQHELKSIPRCAYPADSKGSKICVNPYHYTRIEHNHNYPPVVTPRNDSEFTNASPPPQSPLSPISTYSQQGSPANYMLHLPTTAHEHHHQQSPYDPVPAHTNTYRQDHMISFDQASFNSANNQYNFRQHQQQAQSAGQQPVTFGYSNQSPLSESYFSGQGPNGEPLVGQLARSPHQSFESQTPPPRYMGRTNHLQSNQHGQQALMAMDVEEMHSTQHSLVSGSPPDDREPWCRIHYAELTVKIGDPFKSGAPRVYVDGFTNPSVSDRRFSLGTLTNVNRNSTIEMIRRAIGRGICLENQEGQIFVKNLSEKSIFFHSKNCNVENQLNHHAVVKIEPGKRQKIFDQRVFEGIVQEARMSDEGSAYERLYSLTDHCMIKMSFVKGWGSLYNRQDVTSTPCWIEISLLKPYALLDGYLQEVRPINFNITSTS